MKRQIVVATGNPHKVQELMQLLHAHGLNDVELVPMSQFPIEIEIEEDGMTFEENALIKAKAVFQATGLPTLADDSGLCIEALGGDPGVRSARYAGPRATDAENRDAARKALAAAGFETSPAKFVCVLCYIDPLRTLLTVGESTGIVSLDDRGSGGFGYDPMFTPDGYDVRYAELSAEQKNALSHRARAFEQMARRLTAIFGDAPPSGPPGLSLSDLCTISIAAAIGRGDIIRHVSQRATDQDQRRMLTEAILQSYLFAGFPAALDALNQVGTHREHSLLEDRVEPYDISHFESRGVALCRRIYGHVFDKMMQRFESLSPSLRSWMTIEGYGKTLSRPGLGTIERELCIICMLAALGRDSQLFSHLRGALAIGATLDQIAACVDAVTEICGSGARLRITSTLAKLTTSN